ncbi:MAG TPA: hypothetical protein VGE75_00580 [Acidimicrobiales bacterium]
MEFVRTQKRRRAGLNVLLAGVFAVALGVATSVPVAGAAGKVHSVSTTSATMGDVTATFTYSGTFPEGQHLHLIIRRKGVELLNAPVTSAWCGDMCWPNAIAAGDKVLHVVRLGAGATPDVVLDLYSGGAHCCSIEQVFSFGATSKKVRKSEYNFGDPGARLEKIGPRGATYFVSADDAFAYAFTDFAASGLPIKILAFADGSFHDVTRQFPALIARDATQWLRAFKAQASSRYQDSVGVAAAWAADEDMLGHRGAVKSFLAEQLKAGHLNSALSPIEPSGARFVTALQSFLRKYGYAK